MAPTTPIPEISIWVPVISALAGGLIASIAPIIVAWRNDRAETRRERVRLAVQLAITDHAHLYAVAKDTAAAHRGATIGFPPMSAVLAFHLQLIDALITTNNLGSVDFTAIQERAKKSYDALSTEKGGF